MPNAEFLKVGSINLLEENSENQLYVICEISTGWASLGNNFCWFQDSSASKFFYPVVLHFFLYHHINCMTFCIFCMEFQSQAVNTQDYFPEDFKNNCYENQAKPQLKISK